MLAKVFWKETLNELRSAMLNSEFTGLCRWRAGVDGGARWARVGVVSIVMGISLTIQKYVAPEVF